MRYLFILFLLITKSYAKDICSDTFGELIYIESNDSISFLRNLKNRKSLLEKVKKSQNDLSVIFEKEYYEQLKTELSFIEISKLQLIARQENITAQKILENESQVQYEGLYGQAEAAIKYQLSLKDVKKLFSILLSNNYVFETLKWRSIIGSPDRLVKLARYYEANGIDGFIGIDMQQEIARRFFESNSTDAYNYMDTIKDYFFDGKIIGMMDLGWDPQYRLSDLTPQEKIIFAVKYKDVDAVEKLFTSNMSSLQDDMGRSLLHLLAFSEESKEISKIVYKMTGTQKGFYLKENEDNEKITIEEGMRQIRDIIARSFHYGIKISDLLITRGYDISMRDEKGNNALHFIVEKVCVVISLIKSIRNNMESISHPAKLILDDVFDLIINMIVHLEAKGLDINNKNNWELSIADTMAGWNFSEGVDKLLARGIKIYDKDGNLLLSLK